MPSSQARETTIGRDRLPVAGAPGRLLVADSKVVHNLTDGTKLLERGVLAFLHCLAAQTPHNPPPPRHRARYFPSQCTPSFSSHQRAPAGDGSSKETTDDLLAISVFYPFVTLPMAMALPLYGWLVASDSYTLGMTLLAASRPSLIDWSISQFQQLALFI